jgi:hypothetical protein
LHPLKKRVNEVINDAPQQESTDLLAVFTIVSIITPFPDRDNHRVIVIPLTAVSETWVEPGALRMLNDMINAYK